MASKKRTPNITDLDCQNLRRYREYNPLFDILIEDFDAAFIENEVSDNFILDNYYVDYREDIKISNENIFRQLPGPIVTKASDVSNSMLNKPGMIYLLIGKKGIGKSTLLKYYTKQFISSTKGLKERGDIIIYLNIRNKKTNTKFKSDIHTNLYLELYDHIRRNKKEIYEYLCDPNKIRLLDQAYKNISDNDDLVQRVMDNKAEAINYLLEYFSNINWRLVVIVDNIDDFGEKYVKAIIDWCEELKKHFGIKCIVAVRDYWTPYKLGIDDSKICSMHLSKPHITDILRKRLKSINTKPVEGKLLFDFQGRVIALQSKDIAEFFDRIIVDLAENHEEIQGEILEMVNYNLREYLINMFHFFHSPYLYSRPNLTNIILQKYNDSHKDNKLNLPRPVRFFDFLECFMTPHSLCYDIIDSRIFNVFYHRFLYDEGINYKNILIFIRILQITPDVGSPPLDKERIVNILQAIGYTNEDAIKNAINELLSKALIESPNGTCYNEAECISLSIKGRLYLNKLIKEYSYILFISDDVPMEDEFKVDIKMKFGDDPVPLPGGQLNLKHNSVKNFLKFLKSEEDAEELNCPPDTKPILNDIIGESKISKQIDDNVTLVISKMKQPHLKDYPKLVSVEPKIRKRTA